MSRKSKRLKSAIHTIYLAASRYPAILLFKMNIYPALFIYLRLIAYLPKMAERMKVISFSDIKTGPFNQVFCERETEIEIWLPNSRGKNNCYRVSSIPLYGFKMYKTMVFPGSHLVVLERRAYIDDFHNNSNNGKNRIRYDDRSILIHNEKKLILRKGKYLRKVKRGIHLLDSGGHNYFHFMIELLPKLLLLKEKVPAYAGWPLIVAASYRNMENFRELLRLAGFEQLIYVDENEYLVVEELIYVSKLWNMPFNLKSGCFGADDLRYHPELFRLYESFSRHLLSTLETPFSLPEHILLSRNNTGQRKYNDKEIEGIAIAHGFEIVDTGKMSIKEQFHLFQNAAIIIGPTGASWTNLIFASAGTRALCWMSERWGDFPAFATLAALHDVDLQYIIFPSGSADDPHHDYYLEPENFESRLVELLNPLTGSQRNKISTYE